MERQSLRGEILSTGVLMIYRPRGSGFVGQVCHCVFNKERNCGDDCPAFDEPSFDGSLQLCFGKLTFDEFEDGRE